MYSAEGPISSISMIISTTMSGHLTGKYSYCAYNWNLVNIRAHVLLIILWALHEYFIFLRAPAGVWIMQLVSLRGKRTVAEPPELTHILMHPQTTRQSGIAQVSNYLRF